MTAAEERQPYDIIRLISSLLSVCGSVYIINRLVGEKPWSRPHVRACLAFLVAASDLGFTITQIVTVVVDRSLKDHHDGRDWCWVIGPLVYLSGWFTLVISACIAHYLWYFLGKRPCKSKSIVLLRAYCITAVLYAGGCTAVFSSWSRYSFEGNGGCWIDLRKSYAPWQGSFFVGSVALPVLFALCNLMKTHCELHRMPECVVRRRNRVMERYLLVLVLVWLPVIMRHSYALHFEMVPDGDAYSAMLVTESFLLPLQGFLNAVVFMKSEAHRLACEGRKGLRQVGFGGSIAGDTDGKAYSCLLYTSPSPRDRTRSRMPSSA
eukprot:TRINITY_DN12784_c0_g2_i1.p1 TRINITY_DN12784_c0_g2~~TRINITY_DN12784_c0_g2_i1.p1  ORF type:complete len:321 (+),score=42.41 TRINITY_DN12784_c0_g2_i1:42-1004(+)